MVLHGYYRSSASYRVRIALNLKGVAYRQASHHLRRGEQRSASYLAINPQGLVPALVLDDGEVLTQSLAIIDWLDRNYPVPPLLPEDGLQRARIGAFAQVLACDTHPLQNLRVLERLRQHGLSEGEVTAWAAQVNADGLAVCEALIAGLSGNFCFGDEVSLADVCLVPQLANARRFGVDLSGFPRLLNAERHAAALPAFAAARPENQPDSE